MIKLQIRNWPFDTMSIIGNNDLRDLIALLVETIVSSKTKYYHFIIKNIFNYILCQS